MFNYVTKTSSKVLKLNRWHLQPFGFQDSVIQRSGYTKIPFTSIIIPYEAKNVCSAAANRFLILSCQPKWEPKKRRFPRERSVLRKGSLKLPLPMGRVPSEGLPRNLKKASMFLSQESSLSSWVSSNRSQYMLNQGRLSKAAVNPEQNVTDGPCMQEKCYNGSAQYCH